MAEQSPGSQARRYFLGLGTTAGCWRMALGGCQLVPKPRPERRPEPEPPEAPAASRRSRGPQLPPEETRNRVAVLVPTSGANAGVGQSIANAANLALLDAGGERIRITVYDTARGGAAAAANQALAEGNGLFLGPAARRRRPRGRADRAPRRGAGHQLLQRHQRRRQRGLSDGLHPRPVDRPGRRPCPRSRGSSASARSTPDGVYGRRASQAMIEASSGAGGRLVAMQTYDARAGGPAGPRSAGSTARAATTPC